MSAQPKPVAEEPTVVPIPDDIVDAVMAHYGGDARLAVRELVADCAHLRGELYIAANLMGRGIARGWTPTYERPDETPSGD